LLKSRRFWLGVVVSATFLALFFYRVDFVAMGQVLLEANYIFLLPALAVYFIGVWFRAVRWHYLLHPVGNFASHRLFRLIVIGFTVNNIIPGRLGILLRAYILGEREGVSKIAVGATVGVERVFDGLVLVLFLVVISFFVLLPEGAEVTGLVEVVRWVALGIFLGCLLILLFITFMENTARRVAGALLRRFPSGSRLKWDEWLDAAISGLRLPRRRGRLLAVSVTSLLVWLCEGGMFYLLSLSFNLGQPFHIMLLVMSIATMSWFVLVSPGGVGAFDWFGRETLVVFGVPIATASAAILLIHATLILPVIALGFVFLWMENLSLAEVVGRRQRLSQQHDPKEGAE